MDHLGLVLPEVVRSILFLVVISDDAFTSPIQSYPLAHTRHMTRSDGDEYFFYLNNSYPFSRLILLYLTIHGSLILYKSLDIQLSGLQNQQLLL
jgi:hypothetical protein